MRIFILHSLRSQTTLLKYILVVFLLLSISSGWHSTVHVLKTDQQCELCLGHLDLEQSIPAKITLFESDINYFSFITLNILQCHTEFVAITGNRDPPTFI